MEVFAAGDYGDKGKFAVGDVEKIAADYNPALHEAPVTLDHATSGPAFGWVSKAIAKGAKLLAVADIVDELAEMIKGGRYKKRSVEFTKLKETGRTYLYAVSFLGAMVPTVKGMRNIELSGARDSIEFAEKAEVFTMENTLKDERAKFTRRVMAQAIAGGRDRASALRFACVYTGATPDELETPADDPREKLYRKVKGAALVGGKSEIEAERYARSWSGFNG
jgi:hypothetical protein